MFIRGNAAVFFFLLTLWTSLPAQVPDCGGDPDLIRIGALYMNIDTRKRLFDGMAEAVADFTFKNKRGVCWVDLSYTKISEGLANLRDALKNDRVDIVIGPTESDIFVRAMEEREELERYQIPVISPLITADVDIQEADWFFRTNVGVSQRAHVIFDYLRKYWIRSMAVLYANTEFGRRGEAAFKEEVVRVFGNTDLYISATFDSPPMNIRKKIDVILKRRPEAVGLFGEREEITTILRTMDNMDESETSYEPELFTVLDARQIKQEIGDMLFVSVTKPDSASLNSGKEYDDVKALAYDTMFFVLNVINDLEPRSSFKSRPHYRMKFRDQFAALMNGGSHSLAGPKTGMKFKRYINTQEPKVYKISKGQVGAAGLHKQVSSLTKFGHKLGLIKRRFGLFPIILNVLLILGVVFVTTVWDLIRWYEGKAKKILTYRRTYYLLALQFSVSLILYIYLAETGNIRYDSFLMTVVIAMAPSSLFRAKLLETPWGKTIGLAKIYDQILLKVNEGLMIAKFKDLDKRINIIAQYNSEMGMRAELKAIFSHSRNPEQKARNWRDIEERLKNAENAFERRKIYARRLLRRLGWEELAERRLIPPDLAENGDLEGPSTWVRDSVQFCLDKEKGQKVDEVISKHIPAEGSAREFYDRKLKEAEGNPRDALYAKIHFLVWKLGFKDTQLRDAELLPREDKNTWVRDSEMFCSQSRDGLQKVEQVIEKVLPKRGPIRKFFKNEVQNKEDIYPKIHFLVWKLGFNGDKLEAYGLLPPNGKKKEGQQKEAPITQVKEKTQELKEKVKVV
ncbi:MAG: ABC transporter substrate-binding protein [bacterium]